MSYNDGWAAINLEMPGRVPRTEYSAESHWDLVKAVTGISISQKESTDLEKREARKAFYKAWNHDLVWGICIGDKEFGDMRTTLGHAEYSSDGSNFKDDRGSFFNTPEDVLDFDPREACGQRGKGSIVDQFNADYKAACELAPDAVNMTGIYITCVSGLVQMFGWDLMLLALGTDPDKFNALTDRYAQWMQQYFDALAESDAPVVMVHDDMVWTSGPFTSPDWYRENIFPHYKNYLAPLKEAGKKILYTSDGDYTMFVDDVAETGVHGFVMEPTTDMAYVAEKYGKTHVFVGNADTRILLNGTKAQIRAEVERCMSTGKDCPGFFMAVGNHIPANTPVENALYYNEVYEELSRR